MRQKIVFMCMTMWSSSALDQTMNLNKFSIIFFFLLSFSCFYLYLFMCFSFYFSIAVQGKQYPFHEKHIEFQTIFFLHFYCNVKYKESTWNSRENNFFFFFGKWKKEMRKKYNKENVNDVQYLSFYFCYLVDWRVQRR